MIKKLTVYELLENIRYNEALRKSILKKIDALKKNHPENSPEFQNKAAELNKQMPPTYILEEDCIGIDSGGFKKGKELNIDDVKKLVQLGYQILWVNFGPEIKGFQQIDEKTKLAMEDFAKKKEEIESTISKCMMPIDEANARKPGSTIKILNGDDLIKQNVNALQSDGAYYLLKAAFGDNGKKIQHIPNIIKDIYSSPPDRMGVFENISVGENPKTSQDPDDPERPNFFMKIMINTCLIMTALLSRLQRERTMRSKNPQEEMRRQPPGKRHIIQRKYALDACMGALFTEYGYTHKVLERLLFRLFTELMDVNGMIANEGHVKLSEGQISLLEHHSNVGAHVLGSQKEPPLIEDIAKTVIKFHHRGLNGSGYPKRKTGDERIGIRDADDSIRYEIKNLFEEEIPELVRMAGVINTFCGYLFGTPFRLPFERDSLCRYFLINSEYAINDEGEIDEVGIFDLKTKEKYTKRFDGFLVKEMLKTIQLFKIGEEVPVYNIENLDAPVYEGIVVGLNEMPHRPTLSVDKDGEKEIINLSEDEYNNLFIGEYHPALRFNLALQSMDYSLRNEGVDVPEDVISLNGEDAEEQKRKNKESRMIDAQIDSIFDEPSSPAPVEQAASGDFNLDDFLASTMPSTVKSQPKEKEPKPDTDDQPVDEDDIKVEDIVDDIDDSSDTNQTDEDIKSPDEEKSASDIFTSPDLPELSQDELNLEIKDMLNYIYRLKNNNKTPIGIGKIEGDKAYLYYTAILSNQCGTSSQYSFRRLTQPSTIDHSPQEQSDCPDYGIVLVAGEEELSADDLADITLEKELEGDYAIGDLFIMNYVSELDPKKNPNPPSKDEADKLFGQVRYMVQVVEKTDNPQRPKIKLVKYVKYENGKFTSTVDKNCGKLFDLSKLPAYKLTKKISAAELAQILGLKTSA